MMNSKEGIPEIASVRSTAVSRIISIAGVEPLSTNTVTN
jgi:hypothetical protein